CWMRGLSSSKKKRPKQRRKKRQIRVLEQATRNPAKQFGWSVQHITERHVVRCFRLPLRLRAFWLEGLNAQRRPLPPDQLPDSSGRQIHHGIQFRPRERRA